jgi:ribosomal protein L17
MHAHNKWYQSRVPATMTKGTRISKLVEAMVTLREDNAFDNPFSALINLKQTSTVEKYRSQFEVLFEVLSIDILNILQMNFGLKRSSMDSMWRLDYCSLC